MSRYTARLRALERKLAPPERARWVSLHIEEPGSPPVPDWARSVIEPYTQGGALVLWRGTAGDAAFFACVNGGTLAEQVAGVPPDRWYRVTEAGAERIERPALFTVELDTPDGAGLPESMTPRAESHSKHGRD